MYQSTHLVGHHISPFLGRNTVDPRHSQCESNRLRSILKGVECMDDPLACGTVGNADAAAERDTLCQGPASLLVFLSLLRALQLVN